MQLKVRIRRWVIWWFYVGVFCGGIALANIFGRDLTPSQDRVLLLIGALHWILGGLVCWAFESVKFQSPEPPPGRPQTAVAPRATEWHRSRTTGRREGVTWLMNHPNISDWNSSTAWR